MTYGRLDAAWMLAVYAQGGVHIRLDARKVHSVVLEQDPHNLY